MPSVKVNDTLKEWCAASTMRDMLFMLAENKGISYEEALLEFAKSPIYEGLFDFETLIWKEGPVYLLALYEEYCEKNKLNE